MDFSPPPSYSTATNQHASGGGGLGHQDFLPIKAEGEMESFASIVDRANVWLRQNPLWEVKTAESIEFIYKGSGRVESEKMTYLEWGEHRTRYIRGLRLWLLPRNPEEVQNSQQIGFISFVPRIVEEAGLFSAEKYERLDEMLADVNQKLYSNPIDGKF